MTADLETLIRVRDWKVDQKRRELGDRLRELDNLKVQASVLEGQVAREQEIARSSPDEAGLAYAGYARRVLEHRSELSGAIVDAEAAVSAAKDDLALAYREFKTVEIAQENHRRQEMAEVDRRQTMLQDEMALQGFRHRLAEY